MKLEEFQRLGQTVKTFTSKLHENPGKFVAIITQMYWDMKDERDTLIDDLKVLREKNEKLERENRDYKIANKNVADYGHEWKTECHKIERKLEKVSTAYKTLTDHIRLKASANPGEHRYIALVNFIDRLEKGEN